MEVSFRSIGVAGGSAQAEGLELRIVGFPRDGQSGRVERLGTLAGPGAGEPWVTPMVASVLFAAAAIAAATWIVRGKGLRG